MRLDVGGFILLTQFSQPVCAWAIIVNRLLILVEMTERNSRILESLLPTSFRDPNRSSLKNLKQVTSVHAITHNSFCLNDDFPPCVPRFAQPMCIRTLSSVIGKVSVILTSTFPSETNLAIAPNWSVLGDPLYEMTVMPYSFTRFSFGWPAMVTSGPFCFTCSDDQGNQYGGYENSWTKRKRQITLTFQQGGGYSTLTYS